jgi:hypothetical protein
VYENGSGPIADLHRSHAPAWNGRDFNRRFPISYNGSP